MNRRSSRAARVALAAALSASAALPALTVPTLAAAQQRLPTTLQPAWVHYLINPHRSTSGSLFRVEPLARPDQVFVRYGTAEARYTGLLKLTSDQRGLEGVLKSDAGQAELHVRVRAGSDPSESFMDVFLAPSGQSTGKVMSTVALSLVRDTSFKERQRGMEAVFAAWIGDWQVDGQKLEIRAVGNVLTGTVYASTAGGRIYPHMRLVFRSGAHGPGALDGVWQDVSASTGAMQGGTLAVEMAANKLGFLGDIFRQGSSSSSSWRGIRLAEVPGAQEWKPKVVPGDAVPRPGYVSCGTWCRVRIIASEVKTIPAGSDGKFRPVPLLTLAVHNASDMTQHLQTVPSSNAYEVNTVALAASVGAFDPKARDGIAVGYWVLKPGASGGVWRPEPYQREIELMPGDEVQYTTFIDHAPFTQGFDQLSLVHHYGAGKHSPPARVVAFPEVARWLCPVYLREQELKKSGDLAYEVGELPALCANAPGTPKEPVAQTPTTPASDAGAPPPNPATTPIAGTARPGVFHPLEDFDVRLDEARAGRDGKLHVFLTAKNKAGRDFYMSSGPFRVVASDADGVGVEAQSRPYRATGEQATAFDEVPTIPAGGEFRMRYVLELPAVHGPLTRVSVRESAKKALYFDVAHADPDPSPMPAPATGRGTFKSLSKLDVRIDNVVPGRDGRLEAFVTLRNPTREVQSTSKGEIKLSGTNADGGKATSVSVLHSVRGERGRNDELPLLVYVEPGGEMRLRYVFDEPITGAITVSDGRASQVFTPGG